MKNSNPDRGWPVIPGGRSAEKSGSGLLFQRKLNARSENGMICQNVEKRRKIMGRETVLFKTEEKKSAKEISQTLRLIADKIEEGTMTLSQGQDEVTVTFPAFMEIQLKVEEEEGKRLKKKFEVELEWIPGAAGAGGGSTQIS
jgi:amphi-Trp domain-containing protein